MLVRLAWLNLTRSVRRTVLSLGSVITGVAVIIVGQGVIAGFEENAVRAYVDHMGGHVVVRAKGYPTEGLVHPIDTLAPVPVELGQWLETNSRAWTSRTLLVGRAVNGADALSVRVFAVDPARDASVFPRTSWKLDGREPTSGADGALVSTGVARLLDLGPGDRFVLEARTVAGARNALELPVAGVVSVGTPMVDRFGIYVTDDLVGRLVEPGEGVSHVAIRLSDRSTTEAFARELGKRVDADREVVTWIDETAAVLAFNAVRQAALNLLVLALMGMSATGIANTVLMAAYERVAEVGTLRAMGMTRTGVVRLFVLEGAMVGGIGSLLGAAIGTAAVLITAERGIELPMALATTGNLPVSNVLYLRGSGAVVAFAAAFGVLVSVGASLYPAYVASGRPPAEAVRA